MAGDFPYHAFISYVREDQAWAKLVYDELEDRGLHPFLDTTRLVAGADWDEQLQDAIESSQHLIVLWSRHSRSDWVLDEIHAFKAVTRDAIKREPGTPRHIIPISLDEDEYKPLKKKERIDAIKRARLYQAGPAALPDEVRDVVFDKLERSIRYADVARRVPVLVVTATRAELAAIDPDEPQPAPPLPGESLNSLIARLAVGSFDDLLACYGDERGDWRPFGSAATVTGILDQLENKINRLLEAEKLQPFRWEHLDQFWDSNPPGQVGERLKRESVVVVLDPLSLYVPYVSAMTTKYLLGPIRGNHRAILMVLPPFALPTGAAALRESIKALATEVFESYYDPPVFSSSPAARFVTSVGDEADLKAWLLAGIGPALAAEQGGGHVFTRQ